MSFMLASQFHVYLPWVNTHLALCLNSVLNVKAVVAAFNQALLASGGIVKLQTSRRFVSSSNNGSAAGLIGRRTCVCWHRALPKIALNNPPLLWSRPQAGSSLAPDTGLDITLEQPATRHRSESCPHGIHQDQNILFTIFFLNLAQRLNMKCP